MLYSQQAIMEIRIQRMTELWMFWLSRYCVGPEANKSERAVSDEKSQKSVKAGEHQQESERQEIVSSACLDGDAEMAMLELALVPKRRRSVTARKAADSNKLVVRQTTGTRVENPNMGGFERKWGPEKLVGKRIRVWWPLDNVFYGSMTVYYREKLPNKQEALGSSSDAERTLVEKI